MNKNNEISKIVIAGAGPAGSSLAARHAEMGFDVTLLEREDFPRQKLCGEFISPECRRHFSELGVEDEMLKAGGVVVEETRFYSLSGRCISFPSRVFGGNAVGLSRAVMDNILLERARSAGVRVCTGSMVTGLKAEDDLIASLSFRSGDGSADTESGDLFVDATGRASVLTKLFDRKLNGHSTPQREKTHIAFKAHFKGVAIDPSVCEIYAFPGGYCGVNGVEGGQSNLCFIVRADAARRFGADAERLLAELVCQNSRARLSMKNADRVEDWIAVSISSFGKKRPSEAKNLFSVGDSAAFIDPFTGSGMLLAMESSRLLSRCVSQHRNDLSQIAAAYKQEYSRMFAGRLRVSSLLRRVSAYPAAVSSLIAVLGLFPFAGKLIARSTRGGHLHPSPGVSGDI